MASPVEDYLEVYDAVQRFAECNVSVADYLLEISQLMRTNPRKALDAIATCWPRAEQMHSVIAGSLNAEEQLLRRWEKLPEKHRSGILKDPDSAGSADLGDREFEEIQNEVLEILEGG